MTLTFCDHLWQCASLTQRRREMTESVVVGRAPRRRPSQGRAWAQRAGCRLRPRGARRPCCRESCFELVVCACSDQDSKRLVVSDASRRSRRRVGQQRSRHAVCGRYPVHVAGRSPRASGIPSRNRGRPPLGSWPRPRRGRGSWAARRAAPASERPGRARAQRAGCGLRPRGARRPCYRESCFELVVCASPTRIPRGSLSRTRVGCSMRRVGQQRSRHAVCAGDPVHVAGAAHERAASRRGTGDGRRLVPGQATQRSRKLGCATRGPGERTFGTGRARSRPSSSWGACAPGRHERLLPQDCRASTSARVRDPASGCALGRKWQRQESVLPVCTPAA